MKTIISNILSPLLLALPLFGQISQIHPELCGKPDGVVPLPPNISATVDRSVGQANLFIGPGNSAPKISLPGVVNEIDEVCPISGDRVVIFSSSGYSSWVNVVDSMKASLVDSIHGFSAVMSPNQRWIVYGKFYPRFTELPPSSEYLVYDLTKRPAQNRPASVAVDDYEDVGAVIFPLGQKNLPFDNIDVSKNQQHQLASESFYWSADDRAVVFGDLLQGKFSVVLVTLDENGNTTASVSPISIFDICGKATDIEGLRHLEAAEVGPDQSGDRSIRLGFNNPNCSPKTLEFHPSDFQPAKPEAHTPIKPTNKSILTQ